MRIYDALEKQIKNRYKNTKIKYKSDYLFWQILPKSLRLSGITLGNTIWMPSRTYNVSTLAHEYAHLVQIQELGILGFLFLYLQPQIFALFFLIIAIMCIGFMLPQLMIAAFVLMGISLAPWPSKQRLKLERAGYIMNFAVEKWGSGQNTKRLQKYIVDSLLSWLYYKMTWNRDQINRFVNKMVQEVNEESSELMTNIAYKDTYEIFHNEQT